MRGIKDKFHSLSFSNTIPPNNIADGISSTVCGKRVHATDSLSLDDVLYVPTILRSLLSISKLIKNNYCAIFILPVVCRCVFQDLQTGMRVGSVMNTETFITWMMVHSTLV